MVTKSCNNTNIHWLRSDMWVFMNTAICKCDWRSTMLKVCLYKRIDWISFSIAHYKHTVCHRQSCKKLHHMQRAPRRNCIQTGHKLSNFAFHLSEKQGTSWVDFLFICLNLSFRRLQRVSVGTGQILLWWHRSCEEIMILLSMVKLCSCQDRTNLKTSGTIHKILCCLTQSSY